MEGISPDFFQKKRDSLSKAGFHFYISDENENMLLDHLHTWSIYKKLIDSVIMISGKSTYWEDTGGCTK